jgi:hypothetical protein
MPDIPKYIEKSHDYFRGIWEYSAALPWPWPGTHLSRATVIRGWAAWAELKVESFPVALITTSENQRRL